MLLHRLSLDYIDDATCNIDVYEQTVLKLVAEVEYAAPKGFVLRLDYNLKCVARDANPTQRTVTIGFNYIEEWKVEIYRFWFVTNNSAKWYKDAAALARSMAMFTGSRLAGVRFLKDVPYPASKEKDYYRFVQYEAQLLTQD